jgi:hypothetical protein
MVSIGLSAELTSHELLSVSHMKRLELRYGAEELKDKERKDLAVEIELSPKVLLFTPKPGTQQGRGLQHCFWVLSVSEVTSPLFNFNVFRLTGLLLPSDSNITEQCLSDDAVIQTQDG